MSQTKLAYLGAAIIVVGAATMIYAPEFFYQNDAQIAASATIDHVSPSGTDVAEAPKQ